MLTQNDADFLGSAVGWTVGLVVLIPLFIEIILMVLSKTKKEKGEKDGNK